MVKRGDFFPFSSNKRGFWKTRQRSVVNKGCPASVARAVGAGWGLGGLGDFDPPPPLSVLSAAEIGRSLNSIINRERKLCTPKLLLAPTPWIYRPSYGPPVAFALQPLSSAGKAGFALRPRDGRPCSPRWGCQKSFWLARPLLKKWLQKGLEVYAFLNRSFILK